MTTFSNPADIAREALRLLASRRMPPTPDNYRILYHEIAGLPQDGAAPLPVELLLAVSEMLPRQTTAGQRLGRLLDAGIANGSVEQCRKALGEMAQAVQAAEQPWGTLIPNLVMQWQRDPTDERRQALDRALQGKDAAAIYRRLSALVRTWERAPGVSVAPPANAARAAFDTAASREVRELLAYALETTLHILLRESPRLAQEALDLAAAVRMAETPRAVAAIGLRLHNLTSQLELIAEDEARLRAGLLNLLQLMVDNITELVEDDRWLHGQIALIRDILEQPLRLRVLEDAEQRLKEVIHQQSCIKHQLREAKGAMKNLVATFIDQLALMTENTTGYGDRIERCAQRIRSAQNIADLSSVIDEVIEETRAIRLSARQSHAELHVVRQQAEAAEQRIAELQHELDMTSLMVSHDKLTGALNRRGLDETLEREVARAERQQSSLCLALLDVDNFKALNDTYGHQAGDDALVHLTGIIRSTLRPVDTVARYGGEEFLILLPDTPIEDASSILIRLQRELTKRIFLHRNERLLITFSAGVAQFENGEKADAIIERADQAMYQAKKAGKNRVVAAPRPAAPETAPAAGPQ